MTHDDKRQAFLRGSGGGAHKPPRGPPDRGQCGRSPAFRMRRPDLATNRKNPAGATDRSRDPRPAARAIPPPSKHGTALPTIRPSTWPTPKSVLGNFDDVTFEERGIRARFYRNGTQFHVETQGADGRPTEFNVAYVIGFDPLQQLGDRRTLGSPPGLQRGMGLARRPVDGSIPERHPAGRLAPLDRRCHERQCHVHRVPRDERRHRVRR